MRTDQQLFKAVRLTAVVAVLLFLAALTQRTQAQSNLEATLTVEPIEATVGDPLQMTATVTHPTGYLVIPPDVGPEWGAFTIAGQTPPQTADNGDGTATTTITFDARLFAPGAYTTPPLQLSVTDGAGQLVDVFAPPVDVAISSVLVEGDTELRDIKPQAELPGGTLLPWLIGGGLALAAGALFLWWRRRPEPVTVDNRLPGQLALDHLAAIEAQNLPQAGHYQTYYTQVADTVRTYLAAVYAIPVLERTTGEIRDDLAQAGVSGTLRAQIVNFLQDSDLVKFANFTPDIESAAELLSDARQIVATNEAARSTIGSSPATVNQPPHMLTYSSNGQGTSYEVKQ